MYTSDTETCATLSVQLLADYRNESAIAVHFKILAQTHLIIDFLTFFEKIDSFDTGNDW